MKDLLIAVKMKNNDGTYSDSIPFGVSADNVNYDINHNLIDILGTIDLNKGDIQTQLSSIQSMLDLDMTPMAGSSKLVTSSGIKAALDATAPIIFNTASGSVASFTDGADDMPMKSCVINMEPIQEGSGDPSPENIRPISGRTGVNVVRSGKNLLPITAVDSVTRGVTYTVNYDGTITASGTATGDATLDVGHVLLPPGTYKVNGCPEGGTSTTYRLRVGKGAYSGTLIGTNFGTDFIFTLTELTDVYLRTYVQPNAGEVNLVFKPMISLDGGDYEPYKGSIYTVNWETEAGIMYGGALDIVSGKLTIEWVKSAELSNYPANLTDLGNTLRTGIVYFGLSGFPTVLPSIDGNAYSNILPVRSSGYSSDRPGFYFYNNTGGYLFFPKSSLSTPDADGVNALLAQTPFYVVYKLATPTEIQLTPQEVRTLLGVNNIWSDAGNIAVEYSADTKMYINNKIAETIATVMA